MPRTCSGSGATWSVPRTPRACFNDTYHSSLEVSAGGSEHEPWTELLSLLYLDEEGKGVDRDKMARFVVANRSDPGSIASDVSRARE